MKKIDDTVTLHSSPIKQSRYKATAIILAGGHSTRLGFDKQLIKVGDGYLMDQLIDKLSSLFEDVIIVSNTPELYSGRFVHVVSDHFKEVGPLAGFHAGLSAAQNSICYVTACDMPWISEAFVHYLMKMHLDQPDKEIWTTRRGTMLEPLGGLYSKSLIERIQVLILAGERRIQKLFRYADVGYVAEKTALQYSPDWHMFDNINTSEDLDLFKELVEEKKDHGEVTEDRTLAK